MIIEPTKLFQKDVKSLLKKYKNILNDLKELNKILFENPNAGISLGKKCYKIRLANSSIPTGKSGTYRIVYFFIKENDFISLLSIYSKSDLENMSESEIDKRILNTIK